MNLWIWKINLEYKRKPKDKTMKQIEIEIESINGKKGVAVFPFEKWRNWVPYARVMAIHEQLRSVTKGAPFSVRSERVKK